MDPQQERQRISLGMQLLAWLAVIALLTWYFSGLIERQHNPNTRVDTQLTDAGVREVRLKRNRAGHYVTSGSINGETVIFLLDTGATGVAIPEAVARRLRVPRGRAFQTVTANGLALSYASRLDRVAIGDIELRDIEASITPGLQTEEVLLGMSFLRHIEFTQRGNTLILRQYPGRAG